MAIGKQVFSLVAIPLIMLCLAFAAVPIYSIFCKVTGYGGTTKRAEVGRPIERGTRDFIIYFNADIDSNLPWTFKPAQKYMLTTTGRNTLAFYIAENITDEPYTGIATYNVTPSVAGKYFNKIACFCFDEQTLQPHEKVMMPVAFFVDKEIENDPDLKYVKVITLSYTFFRNP